MGKKDSLKADVNLFIGIIIALLSALFAIFGYAIINVESLTNKQITLGAVALALLCIVAMFAIVKYRKIRKKLEELE